MALIRDGPNRLRKYREHRSNNSEDNSVMIKNNAKVRSLIASLTITTALFGGATSAFAQEPVTGLADCTVTIVDGVQGCLIRMADGTLGFSVIVGGSNEQPDTYDPQPTDNEMAGRMVTIDCPGTGPKTFTWGSAGMAPQTLEGVQAALQLESTDYVSKHLLCEGNDTVDGWIIGSNGSEADGIVQLIKHLPAGTCVDFDPGASQVNADIVNSVDYTDMWRRVLIGDDENAWAQGLKFTVYWTPCDQNDDNSLAEGNATDNGYVNENDDGIVVEDDSNTDDGTFDPAPDPNGCPSTKQGYAEKVVDSGNAVIKVRIVDNGGRQLTSKKFFTVHRPGPNWVLHTPNHPADPGLTRGKETLTVVTVYCKAA